MEGPRRILVADDEQHLAEGIRENLEEEGYECVCVGDGRRALAKILAESWDLVILDVMMPEMDGWSVCESAREHGSDVPILFLTARGLVQDRVKGLRLGGDDYLAKPFHLTELLARVDALMRRRGWLAPAPRRAEAVFGGNTVDFDGYQARSFDGREHSLTPKEVAILAILVEREGAVVSREDILQAVWGHEVFPSTRTIDNFILRLRRRFERDPLAPRHLHTVRGVGYRFVAEPEIDS